MKKLDSLALGMFYHVSNMAYRLFSIDNYALGTICFGLAVLASIGIGFASYHLAVSDTDISMAAIREKASLLGPVFFGCFSVAAMILRKDLRDILSLHHDLEKSGDFQRAIGLILRWFPIGFYLFSLVLAFFGAEKWWSMADLLLAGIGVWFFSCKPPDMSLRMKRWAGKERERLRS